MKKKKKFTDISWLRVFGEPVKRRLNNGKIDVKFYRKKYNIKPEGTFRGQ